MVTFTGHSHLGPLGWIVVGLAIGLAAPTAAISADLAVLKNDAYAVVVQADGTFTVQALPDGNPAPFEPKFVAWHNAQGATNVSVKWDRPIYNLLGWKLADGRTERDLYRAGESFVLSRPKVDRQAGGVQWSLAEPRIELRALLSLPPGNAEPRIRYTMLPKQSGAWSLAYAGAPAAELKNVVELFQPLVWDGRRLPEESFLIPDDQCSIPGCLVETAAGTVGVMVEPRQFPFAMPSHLVRRFGVAVRNADGKAQPICFTPLPGHADSRLSAGDQRSYEVVLVVRPQPLSPTFEHVARRICGFYDRRENTVATLNTALDRMLEFSQSKWGNFDPANRAFSYPDAAGTVKNVSSLHPLGLALATDDEPLFRLQGVPILEFLLSREKFLFALSEEGMKSSQSPSRKMAGPAMPVSELVALDRYARGATPYFSAAAEALYGKDRTLNMEWVSRGNSWASDLWRYRATGNREFLQRASEKADQYIANRVEQAPTDFAEAAGGTFFEYLLPQWKELYELYLDTRNPRHLAAAHRGARRYAQLIWFYPAVPDGNVTVNASGLAPRRGSLDKPGLIPVPKLATPAWRVSEQGMACEGNGTVQRLALFLATHAPWFMRIGHDADDEFLRAIARSAMIGRFANFPGYHFNTVYSTAHELADFPLRTFEELKPTTSMHYNHSLPMASLVLDYLLANVYARSRSKIDFPGEFAESYAFMQGRVFGAAPGKFYDVDNAWLWMPRGLVSTESVDLNYIAARAGDQLCLAFTNECDRAVEQVVFRLDPERFASPFDQVYRASVWRDGRKQANLLEIRDGRGVIDASPRGITAVVIEGVAPKAIFQQAIVGTPTHRADMKYPARHVRFAAPAGEVQAVVVSFGPKSTWLYAYLTADERALRSASLTVTAAGNSSTISDTSFPFEFSLPVADDTTDLQLQLDVIPIGQTATKHLPPVRLPLR